MSAPDELSTILRRLDRLERQNRALRLTVLALVTAGAALALGQAAVGRAQPGAPEVRVKVVEAERFVVRDAAGKERVILFVDNSDPQNRRARLAFFDEQGQFRMGGSVGPNGAGFGITRP